MSRFAIINTMTGAVENVIEYSDQPGNPPPGFSDGYIAMASEEASPGWVMQGDGTLVNPVPEPAQSAPEIISDRQFYQMLAKRGMISEGEALAAVSVGQIPAALQAIVDAIEDVDVKFDTQMKLVGANDFMRSSGTTIVLANAMQKDAAWVDQFWTDASALV